MSKRPCEKRGRPTGTFNVMGDPYVACLLCERRPANCTCPPLSTLAKVEA